VNTDVRAPLVGTDGPLEVGPNHPRHPGLGFDFSPPRRFVPGPRPSEFVPGGGDPYRSLRLGMYQPDPSQSVAVPGVPSGR
jgi:hypothetical protein